MSEYADKLRTVGFLRRKGRSNTTPVLRDDGEVGGTRTEHWDDHVDSTAYARTVHLRTSIEEHP